MHYPTKEAKNVARKATQFTRRYKTLLEQYETFANLNIKLSAKIEQFEASATTNACTINDEQLVRKMKN